MSASCIYVGSVRHRRFSPVEHAFEYPLFMMYLDLDELDEVFAKSPLWSARGPAPARFDRRDHHGDPERPLGESIRDLVERESGLRPGGPIRLLTHLRYFGHGFNPVSFYYCFAEDGETLETIVAEVHNTPWGERHCYVLDESANEGSARTKRYRTEKRFHVSPFMEMDLEHRWHSTLPGRRLGVHIEDRRDGARLFHATLELERREISGRALNLLLIRYPLMTARVVFWIYLEAFKLWLKKTPFHPHPARAERP